MQTERSLTKEQILKSAYRLFYKEGFFRVSVNAIAEKAGITKRTIYYHFESKNEVMAEVMRHRNDVMMGQFEDWAGPDDSDARQFVRSLFSRVREWARGDEWFGSGFTRIGTELAHMPGHPARLAAKAHKKAVEAWMSVQLKEKGISEPEKAAGQVMILLEGGMSLAVIHNDLDYITSSAVAAEHLIQTLQGN